MFSVQKIIIFIFCVFNVLQCIIQYWLLFILYSLPYEDYVGGVVALKEDLFMNMNGISNLYFGWGGEDDDIQRR